MNHRSAYDARTLARDMTRAGFKSAGQRPFDPELDLCDWQRAQESLYMTATA